MNKSLIKIILKKIIEHKTHIFSLISITTIGVAMFIGILSVPSTMQKNAQDYFDKQNYADITISKPIGFSNNDINKLKKVFKNSEIEKSTAYDSIINYGSNEFISRVHTNKTISKPHILKGRNIKNNDECLVDNAAKDSYSKKIEVTMFNQKKKCTVVGIVQAPEYFSNHEKGYSLTSTGSTEVIVFLSQNLLNEYIKDLPNKINYLYLVLKDKPNNQTYQKSYQKYIDKQVKKIESETDSKEIVITGRHNNIGVSNYYDDSSRISEIAAVFPIIFFLVTALVSSSTMSRLIEDDRSQMGTMSAIGYSRSSITSIYIIFSLFAVLVGFTIGNLIGFNLIPPVVMKAYSSLYQLSSFTVYYNQELILQALALSLIMVVGVTLIVTISQTKKDCASLLRPKAPIIGKKILLEKIPIIWNKLSFLLKVSTRNLFRYKKRLIMSVLAIMGCSGLLMCGLGIKSSVDPIVDLQFKKIFKFNSEAYTLPLTSQQTFNEEKSFSKNNDIDNSIATFKTIVKKRKNKTDYNFNVVIPNNDKKLNSFINFGDNKFSKDDVFISKKLAESLNLKINDNINIEIDTKKHNFKITNIVEQYIGNYLYISNDLYKNKTQNVSYNNFLFKHNLSDKKISDILGDKPFVKLISNNNNDNMNDSFSGMNSVVYVMVGFAGVLVMIVMYSLTNINLTERKREIATLKVLGFYDHEVSSYVFRENIILTFLGIIIGLIFGKILHVYIISRVELPDIYFLKTQPLYNYILTIIITFVFSLTINILMRDKINKIDMIDSLKSVE